MHVYACVKVMRLILFRRKRCVFPRLVLIFLPGTQTQRPVSEIICVATLFTSQQSGTVLSAQTRHGNVFFRCRAGFYFFLEFWGGFFLASLTMTPDERFLPSPLLTHLSHTHPCSSALTQNCCCSLRSPSRRTPHTSWWPRCNNSEGWMPSTSLCPEGPDRGRAELWGHQKQKRLGSR